MTGQCRDCRWWELRPGSTILDPDAPEYQPTADGACHRFGLPLGSLIGPCDYSEMPGWETAGAYILSDGEHACFMTEKDFGCVRFEQRDTP